MTAGTFSFTMPIGPIGIVERDGDGNMTGNVILSPEWVNFFQYLLQNLDFLY